MGRRVLITGVSGFWGTELARRLERSTRVRVHRRASTCGRRRPTWSARSSSGPTSATPCCPKLLPQTEVDTVVHCDVLLAPEPGKAPEQLHDINVIGSLQLLAACEKTEHRAHDRGPRLGRHIWSGAERAAVLHRGHGAPLPAAHALPARRRRAGELLRELRAPLPRGDGDDAPLPAHAGHGDRLAAHALPAQPVVPTQLGYDPLLQFVHAEDAVAALEAARAAAGAAGRSTSRARAASRSASCCGSPGACRCRSRRRCSAPRSARRRGSGWRGCLRRRCCGCATG